MNYLRFQYTPLMENDDEDGLMDAEKVRTMMFLAWFLVFF